MQVAAVGASLRRNTESLNPKVKDLTPPEIFSKNQILCAALARFWCDLTESDVAMIPYKSVGFEDRATALVEMFRERKGAPGLRSVETVDMWAQELGLRNQYEWKFRSTIS
jgi:hypothetical protein